VDIGNADVKVDFSYGAILGQELETDDQWGLSQTLLPGIPTTGNRVINNDSQI